MVLQSNLSQVDEAVWGHNELHVSFGSYSSLYLLEGPCQITPVFVHMMYAALIAVIGN